jgi:hypothetical protein
MKKVIFICITMLLVVAFSMTATAALKTWNRTQGGTWTNNNYWTPAGVPVTGDSVVIAITPTGNITGVPTISLLALTINGTCNLEAAASGNTLTVTSTLTVAAGKTITIGNVAGSRMNFVLAATATGYIDGTFVQADGGTNRTFTCNGNLFMGPSGAINGTGSFTLSPGATLTTANPLGINGSVQVTGTITLSTAANYGFNGTVPQVTGSLMPATVNNLTINNTTVPPTPAVTPSQATVVNGILTLASGLLDNATIPVTLGPSGSVVNTGGSVNGPLPVEMTSFAAVMQGTSALLNWSTATEVNNNGFEIERRAVNGEQVTVNSWIKVGFVPGAGTSNSPKSYSFQDAQLAPGAYVYRIKQIDNDGSFKYSASTQVDAGVSDALKLGGNYPNPFNPTTNIQFSVPENGYASLKVYNMLGQEVATLFSGMATAGHYIPATFNASRLASGIYFARLQFNGKSLVQRMLLTK